MWKVMVAAALCCAAGTFAGLWGWSEFSAYRAAKSQEEAARLAEAERKKPQGRQREVVRKWLNDPASAVFRNEAISKRSGDTWCGEVNARNRMGAMVGFRRYVVVFLDPADPELDDVATVAVDPDSRPSDRDQAAFDGKYRAFCD